MDFTITDRKSIQVKRKSLIQERQKMEEQKMELEALRKDMVAAMKAKDKVTKEAVSALIAAVKKAAIDEGCRDDIKGELVDKVILKELKTAKEQIDTCPAERTDLKEEYQARYDIIAKYAPKQMDEAEIKAYIEEKLADVLATGNKGQIMKAVFTYPQISEQQGEPYGSFQITLRIPTHRRPASGYRKTGQGF